MKEPEVTSFSNEQAIVAGQVLAPDIYILDPVMPFQMET